MKQTERYCYWPGIEYRNGIIHDKMSTADPVRTKKQARDQIALWAKDFHILHAFIDVHAGPGLERIRRITLF